MLFYFCLSSILSEINEIIHTKSLALYLSLVVQFSMTVRCARAFPRQLDYYTTSLSCCQQLFEEKYSQITKFVPKPFCIFCTQSTKNDKSRPENPVGSWFAMIFQPLIVDLYQSVALVYQINKLVSDRARLFIIGGADCRFELSYLKNDG